MQDGHAEDLSEGRTVALQETAKKMLSEGLDVSLITKITGLSPEAVNQLK